MVSQLLRERCMLCNLVINVTFFIWRYDATLTVCHDFIIVPPRLKKAFLIYPTFSFFVI